MTPDQQQRWLERARELAVQVQRGFEALQDDENDVVDAFVHHINTLAVTPEWHGKTLDTFLKDMLPLADCCASLEARLVDNRHLFLAHDVNMISNVLLLFLRERLLRGTPAPPPDLTKRLAHSHRVALCWLPKALREAVDRMLGHAIHQAGVAGPQPALPEGAGTFLSMAGSTVRTFLAVLNLVNHNGPHVDALRATLCAPATLASTLGNLAAVYAQFARFPATFKDQAEAWLRLTDIAAELLSLPENAEVDAAVEEDVDVQQQLAAALLPYAAYLLKVADLSSPSWLKAWGKLAPALAAEAVWPDLEATVTAQRSMAMAKGLLRLLRALPRLGKPPQPYQHAWEWIPIPLYTAKAAVVAAMTALTVANHMPQAQLQRDAALQEVQQQGLSTALCLLPITVDLLAAAAGQLAAPAADAGAEAEWGSAALLAYDGALERLLYLMPAAMDLLDPEDSTAEEQRLELQPGELAAAAEAALRFAAQAAALEQPLGPGSVKDGDGVVLKLAMSMAEHILLHLVPAAKQEGSAAPKPGGVRPSLHAQLCFMHTVCKFVGTAATPSADFSSGRGVSAERLVRFAAQQLEFSNYLLFCHVYGGELPPGHARLTPQEHASLTPTEKRALIGSALALCAASTPVVDLLPEGQARETQLVSNLLQLCRFLTVEDLAGALLAQHAQLAGQLVRGLATAMFAVQKGMSHPHVRQEYGLLNICFEAVSRAMKENRRLGPMLLGGAAGELLEATVKWSLVQLEEGRELLCNLLATIATTAGGCFTGSGRKAATRLRTLLRSPAGVAGLPQEGWEALREVRAAADEWLAQEAQQQWRQEQLLLCAEAAATRACSNLACTNLSGASEAGLKAKQCAGCRCVRYCSTASQRADWGAGHKAVCKRLQARKAAGQ